MLTKLRHVGERLRANLWLVPASVVLLTIGLSTLTLQLDHRYGDALADAPLLFTGGAEGATALLSAIAGSMMGVTGTIFSITVVALSLASTQFGPRLLRGFIRDRANQLVLGVFIGTFTFSILTLRSVEHTEGARVPQLTVNVAILLALVSLGFLIFFVHHIAQGIQADTIIAQVSRDLHKAIGQLYPEGLGEELSHDEPAELPPRFEDEAQPVHAQSTGYVQAVDEDELLAAVVEHDAVLRLDVRPGDFVVAGAAIGHAWSDDGGERASEALEKVLLIGRKPTPEQDVEFLVSQLVEVAVRALSPGINDPFTASRCVDRLSAGLSDLSRRRFPSPARADERGKLRVITRRATWHGLVDTAFDQIRQHASRSVSVTIRLLEGIIRVAERLPPEDERIEALRRQARLIAEALPNAGYTSGDEQDVRRRLAKLEERIGPLA